MQYDDDFINKLETVVDSIEDRLEPEISHSSKEVIDRIAPKIHSLLKNGYKIETIYNEICGKSEGKLQISFNTFKYYLAKAKSEKGAIKKPTSSQKLKKKKAQPEPEIKKEQQRPAETKTSQKIMEVSDEKQEQLERDRFADSEFDPDDL